MDQLSWSTDKSSPTITAFTPSTNKQAGDEASMAADVDKEAGDGEAGEEGTPAATISMVSILPTRTEVSQEVRNGRL
jgi:hypothetical protein